MPKPAKLKERQVPGGPEPVRFGPLANYIGFHLRRAQNVSFQAVARRIGQADFTPGLYALLTLIEQNPGITQTALSRADGRDKSSLTPALNGLEKRGLIRRDRIAGDKRSYALHLTPAGAAAAAELHRHAQAHDDDLDRIIGLEHKAQFIRQLRRIIIELSAEPGEACPDDEAQP
jgi:DNA-binding MarR family transcriptional regulator